VPGEFDSKFNRWGMNLWPGATMHCQTVDCAAMCSTIE
jgi:hypothetical protein